LPGSAFAKASGDKGVSAFVEDSADECALAGASADKGRLIDAGTKKRPEGWAAGAIRSINFVGIIRLCRICQEVRIEIYGRRLVAQDPSCTKGLRGSLLSLISAVRYWSVAHRQLSGDIKKKTRHDLGWANNLRDSCEDRYSSPEANS
jgi:hypothetical protein